MNLKKILLSALCTSVLSVAIFTTDCYAQIPSSEIALGGVPCGSKDNYIPFSYVKKFYGEPTKAMDNYTVSEYVYGDTVFIGTSNGNISNIIVTAKNGWKTPAGLGVGMTANDAIRIYGDPDKSETRGNKRVYVYFVDYLDYDKGLLGICYDKETKKITKLDVRRNLEKSEFNNISYTIWLNVMFGE